MGTRLIESSPSDRVSDAAILEPQQLEINDITTQWSKHRRVAVSKVFAKKKVIDVNEIEKMMSESVKAVVQVNSQDLSKDIKFVEATIPDDFRIAREMIRQDAREAIGFSRNQLGEVQGKTHVSAKEQQAVERGSEIRVDERRDVVADTLVAMMRKVNQTIFKLWKQERVIQIAGQDGAVHWIRYTGSQLQGEYAIKMDPDAALPSNKEERKQRLLQLAGLVQQTGGNMMPILAQIVSEEPGLNINEILPGVAVPPPGGRFPAPGGPQQPQSVQQFTQGQQRAAGGGGGNGGGGGRFSQVGAGIAR